MAVHAVTGAFGFSGQYIAKRLLETGETSLAAWVRENRTTLDRRYHGEMARRTDRARAY